MISRLVAGLGAVLAWASLSIIAVARSTVHRDAYVSELGAQGEPTAKWFQAALLLLVLAGLSVAWVGRRIRSRVAVLRWWPPSVSLTIASVLFLVASQVTCTSGCPVPRFGPNLSWQDLGHVTAATLAFAFAAWAMLQCAFAIGHRVIRRFSLVAAVSVAVISATGGLMSVFNFYAGLGSYLEFTATTIGIAWVAVYGAALSLERTALERSSARGDLAQGGVTPHGGEQAVGEGNESANLGVVPVDPAALGLTGDRNELVVPLPDNQGALSP